MAELPQARSRHPTDRIHPSGRDICEKLKDGDWPHVGHQPETIPTESELLGLFFKCAPDEGIRRKILLDNPACLYDF